MADPTPGLILKREPPLRSRVVYQGGVWLLNAGVVLAVVSAVIAGGLFFYRRALEATRQSWRTQVAGQEAELRPELLQQLVDLSNAMAVVRELVANHTFGSNLFALLEGAAHPKVQLTTFAFSREHQAIDVAGVALSYQTVAEQVSLLEGHPQVAKVDFGGLARNEKGLVNFKLSITVKPSLLKLRSQ